MNFLYLLKRFSNLLFTITTIMIYTYDINVFFLNIKKLTSKHVCSIIKKFSYPNIDILQFIWIIEILLYSIVY